MILSRSEIDRQVSLGRITIVPYEPAQLNPVSYNYRLGTEIMEQHTQSRRPEIMLIPAKGYLLRPDRLYLASTAEEIGSSDFVVSLIGRSSVGRLGLFVQLAADLGNLGAVHRWTLELHCVQPILVYPKMLIGQVSFWKPLGSLTRYAGLYSAYSTPMPNLRPALEC
jgi:dCTP deaminase